MSEVSTEVIHRVEGKHQRQPKPGDVKPRQRDALSDEDMVGWLKQIIGTCNGTGYALDEVGTVETPNEKRMLEMYKTATRAKGDIEKLILKFIKASEKI